MKNILNHSFEEIISVDNLLCAWKEFLKGKRGKKDVGEFSLHLMDNILELHRELANKTYKHSDYNAFKISDPKPRDIHKASVRDRLLHRAIYRILYPFFDKKFISDSFSCRNLKGTHKAMDRFKSFAGKMSKNHTKTCFVLKCDIRKFFASINHDILINILKKDIQDKNIIWLLEKVVASYFSVTRNVKRSSENPSRTLSEFKLAKAGLPLGNLTSQLFSNIYLNEQDQFIRHGLEVKYYIRYADDFVILSRDKKYLEKLIPVIGEFLDKNLKLELHPDKVFIKTVSSGVDFLGWVHFPKHRVLRTATKRRMMKKISKKNVESYMGLLKYGNSYKLKKLWDLASAGMLIRQAGMTSV